MSKNSEPISAEEEERLKESLAKGLKLLQDLEALLIDELEILVQNSYDNAARKEWSDEQFRALDLLLKPSRERLFAERGIIYEEDLEEALEELADDGTLLRVRVGEAGRPIFRVRRPQ